jgi:hypothetical protein
MMPPLVAIVDIYRKTDGRTFHLWLPIFLVWLLLLPLVLLLLPIVIIAGLIAGIQIFAAMGAMLRVMNGLNGTNIEIDRTTRRIVIHLI